MPAGEDPRGEFAPLAELLAQTAHDVRRDPVLRGRPDVEAGLLQALHLLASLMATGARLVYREHPPTSGRWCWRLAPGALTVRDWQKIGALLQDTDPMAVALLETALAELAPPDLAPPDPPGPLPVRPPD